MGRGNPNPSPKHRWKKGQSGNPKGRKKGLVETRRVLRDLLDAVTDTGYLDPEDRHKNELEAVAKKKGQEYTNRLAICLKHIIQAKEGNVTSAHFVFDRVDGKPVQHNVNEHSILALEDIISGEAKYSDEEE